MTFTVLFRIQQYLYISDSFSTEASRLRQQRQQDVELELQGVSNLDKTHIVHNVKSI